MVKPEPAGTDAGGQVLSLPGPAMTKTRAGRRGAQVSSCPADGAGMTELAVTAPAEGTPRSAYRVLERRATVTTAAALLVLAGLAWSRWRR